MEEVKPVITTRLNLKKYTMTKCAKVSDQQESDAAENTVAVAKKSKETIVKFSKETLIKEIRLVETGQKNCLNLGMNSNQ